MSPIYPLRPLLSTGVPLRTSSTGVPRRTLASAGFGHGRYLYLLVEAGLGVPTQGLDCVLSLHRRAARDQGSARIADAGLRLPRQGLDCRGRVWIAEVGLGLPGQGLECRGRAWSAEAGLGVPRQGSGLVRQGIPLRTGLCVTRGRRGLPRQGLDCRGRVGIAVYLLVWRLTYTSACATELSSPLSRHLVGGGVVARRGVVRSSIKHAHFRRWLTP